MKAVWKGIVRAEAPKEDLIYIEDWGHDNAWAYPEPKPSAIEKVKKDFSNYVAFWRDVSIEE